MTLNEYYAKKNKTEDECAVSDFLDDFIRDFGGFWFYLHGTGQAEELVQRLWEMRIK